MSVKIRKLSLSVAMCLAAGFVGSFFTYSSIPTWYASLNKPSFAPPNWIFAPVWTSLYILMGISFYLVWTSKSKIKQGGVNLFLVQLGFNVLWSILFFGMRSPILAFTDIVVLWATISLTIIYFYAVSRPAALLLVPYVFWVSFASLLNLYIVLLN